MLTEADKDEIRRLARVEFAFLERQPTPTLPLVIEIPDDSPLSRLPNTEPRKEA